MAHTRTWLHRRRRAAPRGGGWQRHPRHLARLVVPARHARLALTPLAWRHPTRTG